MHVCLFRKNDPHDAIERIAKGDFKSHIQLISSDTHFPFGSL